VDPRAAESYSTGFDLLIRTGNCERALFHFREAIRRNPCYEEAYLAMGFCNERLERYDEAIEAYEQAIRIRPDYAQAHFLLGRILSRNGRY
jgi:tetratricopeptide (TPR) repeat protein